MTDAETVKKYKVTIGIECHVQLKTRTKLFSGAGNDARTAAPNTLVNHIDFGLPGALPVLNSEAVHLASRAGFALNSAPQKFSKFDRKHYFYPDLPMGYQITQYEEPIIIGGYVEICVGGSTKRIGITRAHLEADAGKSTHPHGKDYSLVDLNRAGTPLLEIVSEPDMSSAAEAKAYCKELRLLMKYAEVSEVSLYYGNMRFDVNVSVSKTSELGIRSETKNLNSFKSVEKTVELEAKRQIEELEKGNKVIQETRGFDDAKQKTFTQRVKENADDYRYMPDPDIPPVVLDQNYIEDIRAEMPAMPSEYRKILSEIGIDTETAEDILAVPETAKTARRIFESVGKDHARRVAFWLLQPGDETDDSSRSPESRVQSPEIPDESLIKLSQMVGADKLSSTAAKEVLAELLTSGGDPEKIAETKNLLQVSDESEIIKIVDQVLAENAQAASDVKAGEIKAIGFLVGQVMKASRGKANPALAQQLIRKQLGI